MDLRHLGARGLAAACAARGERVSVGAITKLRAGGSARVSVQLVGRLAFALTVDAGWLAYGTGTPPTGPGGTDGAAR